MSDKFTKTFEIDENGDCQKCLDECQHLRVPLFEDGITPYRCNIGHEITDSKYCLNGPDWSVF